MKIKLAALFTLIAVGLHAYLAFHYYDLNMGLPAGESFCNISDKFNCDSVALSQYSTFLNVPLALWGAVANGVLLLLLLGWMIGWSEDLELTSRSSFAWSLFIAAASVVMGLISILFLSTYCLFCIATYFISFINVFLIYKEINSTPQLFSTLRAWLSQKTYLGFVAAIPVITFFIHFSVVKKPQAATLERQMTSFISQWSNNPIQSFEVTPLFTIGEAGSAKMQITEFADFRCHHCKTAAPILKSFTNSRPGVALNFYVFPLEKVPDTDPENKCISCNLAKAVYCSKGAEVKMHEHLFEAQEQILGLSYEKVNEKVAQLANDIGVPAEGFASCYKGPEAHNVVKSMAKLGEKVQVQGTPTIFVNGKKLTGGQLFPVLESVYNLVTDSK